MYGDMYGFNPRRHRRKRRNPARALALPKMGELSQGVDFMDAGAAVGGFAAATMIPGMLMKTSVTTMQKVLKVALSVGCAFGAGWAARNFMSAKVAKAAVIGGLAGAGAHAIGAFTGISIGNRLALPNPSGRGLGITEPVSYPTTREGETVNLIRP